MKLKFSLFFIFYPLKCFKGKKCLSPVAITQPQDYHIWMTSLFDVVLSFNMFLVSFTVMGLPHWKRSVSIATTVMDDSSPKLLEHRKTELQERRKTYRFSQSMWILVSVCVCVCHPVCVCVSGGSLGLQGFPDALMPKRRQIYRKTLDLRMRRGAILSILCTTRKPKHTLILLHTPHQNYPIWLFITQLES